jgi:hypothetical protein
MQDIHLPWGGGYEYPYLRSLMLTGDGLLLRVESFRVPTMAV